MVRLELPDLCFRVAGSTCDALGYLSHAITQTPSVTHQVTVCLIRLRGDRWPREPNASRRPHLHSPNKNGGQTLISKKEGAELLPSVTSDYLAIRQSRKRSRPNARGFRSRSMLPWEAWGVVAFGREAWTFRSGRAQQPGTRRASTCRAFAHLQGTSRGLSMPSSLVWVHVFPSHRRVGAYLTRNLVMGC